MKKFVCCICGNKCSGYGNNPYPLCHIDDYESRCCNDCDNLVLQARMKIAFQKITAEEVQKKYLGKVCEKK